MPEQKLLDRLRFLSKVVRLEGQHLVATDARLFAEQFTLDRAQRLSGSIEEAERVDAFVGRFGRLQDTVGTSSCQHTWRPLESSRARPWTTLTAQSAYT